MVEDCMRNMLRRIKYIKNIFLTIFYRNIFRKRKDLLFFEKKWKIKIYIKIYFFITYSGVHADFH